MIKKLLNPVCIAIFCFMVFFLSTFFFVEWNKTYLYILISGLGTAVLLAVLLKYYIKQFQQKIEQKQQEITNLLKYSPLIIYIADEEGNTELASENVSEWIDADVEKLKNQKGYWYTFIHPEDLDLVKEIYKQKETGKNYSIEYRIRFKDGNYYWIKDEYHYVRYNDGSLHIIGYIKNIHHEHLTRLIQEKAEKEAKEKEMMFQVLADNLPIGMLMARPSNGLIYVNQQAKVNRGLPLNVTPKEVQEYYTKNIYHFVHPEDIEKLNTQVSTIKNTLGRGETFISLKRMRKFEKDSYRWFRSYVLCAEDSYGRYVFEIEQDIHDEHVMQEKLKKSEQNYRLLFDKSPIAKIIFDKETYKILAINHRVCELLKYSEHELLQMTVLDIRDKEAQNILLSDFASKEVFVQKRIRKIRSKQNEEIIVETFAHEIDFEGIPAIMSVIIDVTEQIKTKQSYVETEKRYRNLFEHNLIGVFRSKLDGTIVDANTAFASLLGYTVEEVLNINARDLYYYKEDRSVYIDTLQKQGKIENYEVMLKTKQGEIRYIIENVILTYQNGEYYIEGTVMDVTERKQNEQKIQNLLEETLKTKQRLTYLVEYSPLPIIEWDEYRKITLWNPAAEKLFGYTQQEVLGKTTKMIIAERDIERAKENTQLLYQNRQSYTTLLLHNITRNNKEIICLWSNALIKDENDNIKGVVSIAQDITQQVKAERTLKEREHLLSLIYDTATSAICVLNEEGIFQKVNKAFTDITGYEEKDVIGKPFISILKEKDQELARTHQLKVIYGLVHKLRNWQIRKKNGEFCDVYIVSQDIKSDDGSVMLVTTFTDITQIKKSEFLLKQSELKYKNLFENSIVGIFRTTLDGRMLEANQKAKEIFGWHNIHEINMPNDIYVHSEDRNRLLELLKTEGVAENYEFLARKRNGEQIWISISAQFYPEFNWVEGACIDITEAKNNLIALQKANFELDSFTYRASHDLKAPLRSILGLVNLAKEEELSPEISHYFQLIEKSVLRLDSFVVDLLALSRNNRTEVVIDSVSWEEQINKCLEGLAYMDNYQKTKINLEIHQKEDFYSDPTRIDLIINNLIANAIKYQPKNLEHKPKVSIKAHVFKHHTLLMVEDNGEGIPYHYQNKVFDMFFRASTNSEGSGLGLYIVKSAVEKLEGNIKLQSEPDIGTKFTIILPNLKKEDTL
jgi:PAS domain S-box-containing protein